MAFLSGTICLHGIARGCCPTAKHLQGCVGLLNRVWLQGDLDGRMTYLGDPGRCAFDAEGGGGPFIVAAESEWVHWAASYDGRAMVMYKDGIEIARDSTTQVWLIGFERRTTQCLGALPGHLSTYPPLGVSRSAIA